MAKKGIDVSVWQGDIDWSKASQAVDFCIIRAGYGNNTKDKKFEQNYTGCKNNNVKVGVYWYNYAKTVDGAKTEARGLLSVLNGRKLDYPVWYDIEEKATFNTGKTNVSAMAKAFCEIVEKAGYKVGIYSSKSGLQTYFTNEVKDKYEIWLANVGSNGNALSSTSYSGRYEIWQYSWKGRIAGISGDVDLDYCYKDYSNLNETEEKPKETAAKEPAEKTADIKTEKPVEKKDEKNIDVFYKVNAGKKWYAEVKNDTDYAGVEGKTISGFTAKASDGELKYRVHLPNGRWLGWINKYDSNDWNKGVAGIQGRSIDGLQMDYDKIGFKVMYRVSLIGQNGYLPWVEGTKDYAGIFGKLIDKIQVKIVKK